MRRSVFVFVSYALIAVRKMVRKLEEGVEVVWDIMAAPGFQMGCFDEREAARPSRGERVTASCLCEKP